MTPPDRRSWPFEEMLTIVERDWESRDVARRPRVLVVPGNFPFHRSGFSYLASEKFPGLRLDGPPLFAPPGSRAHRHPGVERLLGSDYYLVRRGDLNGDRNDTYRYGRAAKRFLEWDRAAGGRQFERLATIPLPNGTFSDIYRLRRVWTEEMLLDGLDWVHELDPDDPSVRTSLETSMERGHVSQEAGEALLAALGPGTNRDEALARLAELAPGLRWSVRLRAQRLAEGSGTRVPPYATLIYDIEVISVRG